MKTITALFDELASAERAVTKLENAGIPSSDISIVSRAEDDEGGAAEGAGIGGGLGAAIGGTGGLLAGLGIMAIPGVGPVVAAGWLTATLAGALGGAAVGGATGGLIGALTDSGISEEEANVYAEGVRRGGALVTVRIPEARSAEVENILSSARKVDIAERRRLYTDDGWERFDVEADPYTIDEIEREKRRYL